MKRLTMLVLALVLFCSVGFAAPTTVDMNWAGGGLVSSEITNKDLHTAFISSGELIQGNYNFVKTESYPHYNMDTQLDYLNAVVVNGSIKKQTVKLDNFAPAYGPAGQTSYDYVMVDGGFGALASGDWTNYASLKQPTYAKPKTPNGYNMEANAASFIMGKELTTGTFGGNLGSLDPTVSATPEITGSAYVKAMGSGEAKLHAMCSEVNSNNWGIKLGHGCGCHTNAKYTASGTGSFMFGGTGEDSVTFEGLYDGTGNKITTSGDGNFGSASLQFIATYTQDNYHFSNYATTVK